MSIRRPPLSCALRLLSGLVLLTQAGCMSALTTASLRNALLDAVDSLTESIPADAPHATKDAEFAARLATDEVVDESAPIATKPPLSLDEAVERAVARLNGTGELDSDTQATLLSLLETTSPEDWPAAIDAFTASLAASQPARSPATPATPDPPAPDMLPVVQTTEPQPPAPPAPHLEPAHLVVVEVARPAVLEPPAPADPSPALVEAPLALEEPIADGDIAAITVEPAPAAELAIRNACFVSRVRAWGVVDRFPQAIFRPGQDVIVYFELDAPVARESDAGHATSIDTTFRLVTSAGRQVGHWDFEPIDETSHAPRRDYFARYFLHIPDSAPAGPCRLEFVVSDLVSGASAQTHLEIEVR